MTTKDQTHGVMVRGDDGSLYFIPHDKLQHFKVPEKGVAVAAAKVPQGNVAAHTSVSTAWMMEMPACFLAHE